MAHFFPGGIALIYVAAALTPAGAEPVDFTRDVHPILAERCFACHGGDKRSGGLSLKDYREVMRGGRSGKVVTPGSGNDSLLIRRVLGEAGLVMPPAGARLSAEQIAKLRAWIDQGARERWNSAPARPNWVAKLALEKPQAGADSVDGILARYFEKLGKAQPRPAPDRVFARRAYLDAWGLPPSPEQWSEFAAASGPDKRARLVRVLLANRRNYAEHWITFWNDLLRNDEGVNYHGGRKSITGWLYRALEDNLPYNQFVAALLNPVAEGDPDGFLMGVNWRGDVSASQTPVMQAAQNSAQVFLGVNLKCNSCHDSFISRWKLKDAYGLASFFSDTRLELVRCDVRMGEYAEPKFLYPELGGAKASDTLWARQAIAARLFTAPANGRLARTIVNRIWQRLMGHGLVEPVDDMDAEPWNPELLDWLAWDFADHGYDLKHLIARIMTSSAYQMPATDPDHSENYVFRGPEFRRLTAEQFMDTLSAITGEWRVLTQPRERLAVYARDWRLASSPLTRALGRPIRDQVFTERSTDATTLQALETVNGETLTRFLDRAAKEMLGELPAPPRNLFDSGRMTRGRVQVNIDISGANELRLIVQDVDSYSPERVLPVWSGVRLIGPAGTENLGDLPVKAPSETVLRIAGKGYTRLEATAAIDPRCLSSDINPNIRFFIFKEKPDRERLVQAGGVPPTPPITWKFTSDTLITRVYRHALLRDATPDERRLALKLLGGKPTPDGLADLLWAVAMLPEFQIIP